MNLGKTVREKNYCENCGAMFYTAAGKMKHIEGNTNCRLYNCWVCKSDVFMKNIIPHFATTEHALNETEEEQSCERGSSILDFGTVINTEEMIMPPTKQHVVDIFNIEEELMNIHFEHPHSEDIANAYHQSNSEI